LCHSCCHPFTVISFFPPEVLVFLFPLTTRALSFTLLRVRSCSSQDFFILKAGGPIHLVFLKHSIYLGDHPPFCLFHFDFFFFLFKLEPTAEGTPVGLFLCSPFSLSLRLEAFFSTLGENSFSVTSLLRTRLSFPSFLDESFSYKTPFFLGPFFKFSPCERGHRVPS